MYLQKIGNMKLFLCIIGLYSTILLNGQQTISSFMFGHSLMDHAATPPTDQTKIAYWINELSLVNGHTYAMGGQFGSIWDFANYNVQSQWSVSTVPPSWDSGAFNDATINNSIFTIYNYVQDVLPSDNYPYFGSSVLNATQRLIDSLTTYHTPIDLFLYECWPDMAGFTSGSTFNPTAQEFVNYQNYVLGDYQDWWENLHDSILVSRPTLQVRMIPVAAVISELLNTAPFDTIPITDLYEDNAPHGKPSIYFLAGLATYMAIYGEIAPSYIVPTTVHPCIAENYQTIVNSFWNYFQNYNDGNGNNRVLLVSNMDTDIDNDGIVDSLDNCPTISNVNQNDYDGDGIGDLCDVPNSKVIIENGLLYSKSPEGLLLKGRNGSCFLLYIDSTGTQIIEPRPCPE